MLNFRGSRVLWGYVFNGTKKTRIIDLVVKFIGRWHPFFLNSYDTSSFVFVPDWWSVVSGQWPRRSIRTGGRRRRRMKRRRRSSSVRRDTALHGGLGGWCKSMRWGRCTGSFSSASRSVGRRWLAWRCLSGKRESVEFNFAGVIQVSVCFGFTGSQSLNCQIKFPIRRIQKKILCNS